MIAMSTYDGDGEQHTMVAAQVVETLQWCLRVFANEDESFAARRLVAVRYSPITCSVAEALHTMLEYQPLYYWPPGSQAQVESVLSYSAMINSSPHVPPRG